MSDAEPAEADRQGVLEILERHGVRYVVIDRRRGRRGARLARAQPRHRCGPRPG
ncbi:MAG: hypothetical protein ACHQE6_10145 [Solirubrobacterales bacterium]